MTAHVTQLLIAWAIGYGLGYTAWFIRQARYAGS